MAATDRLRSSISEAYRARLLGKETVKALTPPPPSAFGSFGPNSWLVPPCRVHKAEYIHIGEGVVIHEYSNLSVVQAFDDTIPALRIGDRTNIGAQCHIACIGQVDIGVEVLCAARVFIGDTYHAYEDPDMSILNQAMKRPAPVIIEDGAFMGVGSAVLMGVTIGRQAYIGAGAVVTEDVPARTLVVGNPARPVRRYDDEGRAWVKVTP